MGTPARIPNPDEHDSDGNSSAGIQGDDLGVSDDPEPEPGFDPAHPDEDDPSSSSSRESEPEPGFDPAHPLGNADGDALD